MSTIYKFSNYEDAARYASQFNSKDIIIYTKPREVDNELSLSYSMWHVEVIGQTNDMGSGAYIEVPKNQYSDEQYQWSDLTHHALNNRYQYNGHRLVCDDTTPAFNTMFSKVNTFDTEDFRNYLATCENTYNIHSSYLGN